MGEHQGEGSPSNRFVQFQEEVVVHHSVNTTDHEDGHNDMPALWYSDDEMQVFRTDFMSQCDQTMQAQATPFFPFQPIGKRRLNIESLIISNDVMARGLEYACCYERQRRASLGRKVIVESSVASMKGFDLARVAHQCNEWAAEVAIQQAAQDARWVTGSSP